MYHRLNYAKDSLCFVVVTLNLWIGIGNFGDVM